MLNAMADARRRGNPDPVAKTEILSTWQLKYNIKSYDKNMYSNTHLQNIPDCPRAPRTHRGEATVRDVSPSDVRRLFNTAHCQY